MICNVVTDFNLFYLRRQRGEIESGISEENMGLVLMLKKLCQYQNNICVFA